MSPRLTDLFLSAQSDERLVALARAGHERAFAMIVERYGPELNAMARRLCADGRGEDVVQQAFLSAFAALRSGAEVKHLRGWLYRILRNAAYRSRSPQHAPLDGATASIETVEDVVQQRALAMNTLTELANLPARQRQAMVGTALGGLPRAELATSMGLSEGAVRQLVHRARTTLRGAVTAVTPWPLARWLAAVPADASGTAGLAAGAGAASSGAFALKLGAVFASGTLIAGVATVDLQRSRPSHPSAPRAAAAGPARASVHRAVPLMAAATVVPATGQAAAPSAVVRVVTHGRTPAGPGDSRGGRHESSGGRTGTRHDGSGHHDGGFGSASGSGSDGRDGSPRGFGHSDSTSRGSGSQQSGSGRDGSGGASGTIAGATLEHGDRSGSDVPVTDAVRTDGGSHDGSGSRDGSSGTKSGSGSSTSTSTSTSGSGSGGGSSSTDGEGTPSG